MNNISLKEDIITLKKHISSLPLFEEYFRLKNALKNDKTLQNSDKIIIFSNYNSLKKEEKQRYAYLKIHANQFPLLANFLSLKEDVEEFILEFNKLLNL